MARCGYNTQDPGEKWECPQDVLPGEEYYHYWHKEEERKEPTEEQLGELRAKEIVGVYLQRAELFRVNLRETCLTEANLQKAHLAWANLRGANLHGADLQRANLFYANLQEADLHVANLKKADLTGATFQAAYLSGANLKGTNLSGAKLQGADLCGTMFDSQTVFDGAVLVNANLFHSYFDEAKSFRNATVFLDGAGDREINEAVGDALDDSKIALLTVTLSIRLKAPDVAANLRECGLTIYVENSEEIVLFDKSSRCVIDNPKNWQRRNWWRRSRGLIRVNELNDIILKDGKIRSEFLYTGSRAKLYEASYEVYNNLYNFYIANGRLDQASHVHYRRGEAHRKLRWARGGWKNWIGLKYKMRSIFDLVILNLFTGYGDRVSRPIIWSGVMIGAFAALFWHFDGIVKNVNVIPINGTSNDTVMYVNNTQVAPDWVDYLYHSITTFTSLGYSNIQPNLVAGHLPQVLVAAESGLGILMMALIIFVVTYQVSR